MRHHEQRGSVAGDAAGVVVARVGMGACMHECVVVGGGARASQVHCLMLLVNRCAPRAAAGGASLHSCMTPHGPDTKTFEGATTPEAEQIGHLPR